MSVFESELKFEEAIISVLKRKGWVDGLLCNATEEDLIENWKNILFQNNREKDRLNDKKLIKEEMDQILEQITSLKTPLKLNQFINGKTISIIRKNPEDELHYGKEISLKIFDREEISAGQTVYQIAEQPIFKRGNSMSQDRRGDIMLLINGMPVIHIELKRSGVPVMQACNQIMKYSKEGIFTGIYSLIQIFVGMTPEEMLYFANPGSDGVFNPDFYFKWLDFYNEPITNWKNIAELFLSIPMAHQLIGNYTIADDNDGILKVMRSYQIYAANSIFARVAKHDWKSKKQLGGYVWHTTGSGKTMTSFKSAQLIADSHNADKVVFLMDRIELGTQSLKEYRGFADRAQDVQDTEDTITLIDKLKSKDPKNTLIVSSIQKMSNIKEEAEFKRISADLELMRSKRIVFIVDECHRSTFGEMLITIKQTFPNALFFGFTGTPVFLENQKILNTTADIFGDELHRYSIADGIRDKNVLGFDPTMVMVFPDAKIRKEVALRKANSNSVEEVLKDDKKKEVFYHYMDANLVPMAGYIDENGNYIKGIENEIPVEQYQKSSYQNAVVEDICNSWDVLSRGSQFHAIFATSSIPEAISYYRLFKNQRPNLKVACLFDPTIDNEGNPALEKENGIIEQLTDYNQIFSQSFDISSYPKYKKDVSARLAHKKPYERISADKQLDLLIVVNQMLTGFDSKYINTLYLDKVLEYQNLIQAFSRTNRLYNINEKPFGNIRYYRYPHTMKQNIEKAVALYSGDKPKGLFADHLPVHIGYMNLLFDEMKDLYIQNGVENFERLPEDMEVRAKFAKLFRKYSTYLQAAQIQGFAWDKQEYTVLENGTEEVIVSTSKYEIYLRLVQRYKELEHSHSVDGEDFSFEIDPYLIDQNTGIIDYQYMNSRFDKWKRQLQMGNISSEELMKTLDEVHQSYAFLSQEEQESARLFLHDVEAGEVNFEEGLTFHDYIVKYTKRKKDAQVKQMHEYFGLDEALMFQMLDSNLTPANYNEYGRFDKLMDTYDKVKSQHYLSQLEKVEVPRFKVKTKVEKIVKEFLMNDGNVIEDQNKD